MVRNCSLSPGCFAGRAGDDASGQAKGVIQGLKSPARQVSNASWGFSLET